MAAVGFFYQNNCEQRIGFLPTSTDGKLKSESADVVNLDESIDSLGGRKNVYIAGSSEGFLLCCRQTSKDPRLSFMLDHKTNKQVFVGQLRKEYPMDYYVYNPATRQSVEIPRPACRHKQVGVGFSVADHDHDDLVSFTIVRYGAPEIFFDAQSSVSVEIYSSETGAWTEMNMELGAGPNYIYPIENPGVVIDGVCFWADSGPQLFAIDLVGKNCWFPDLPRPVEEIRYNHFYYLYGSKDRLYCVSLEPGTMRIWELQSDVRCTSPTRWVAKHEGLDTSHSAMVDKLPEFLGPADSPKKYGRPLGVDPNRPQIMYYDSNTKVVSVDVEKHTMEFVNKLPDSPHWAITMDYDYYPYEWSTKKAGPVAAAFESRL